MTVEYESFQDFFSCAFGNKQPFDYQSRLAVESLPELVSVPTGAGKTAAILGAWLWRRLKNPESVGRRLIYCLPMRTLVEQTREVAQNAIKNLGVEDRFSVHTLYGGDVSDDWDIFPEREQILIGTQDLLLSRALNRGYAMNRFRWAFHFGLLNNDCLWVFDEIQLFGDGLATTTQLQAFREDTEKFGVFGKAKSVWMSATLDKNWLKTIDFKPKVENLTTLSLSEKDRQSNILSKRLNAVKNFTKLR
jgi:Predicted helicases